MKIRVFDSNTLVAIAFALLLTIGALLFVVVPGVSVAVAAVARSQWCVSGGRSVPCGSTSTPATNNGSTGGGSAEQMAAWCPTAGGQLACLPCPSGNVACPAVCPLVCKMGATTYQSVPAGYGTTTTTTVSPRADVLLPSKPIPSGFGAAYNLFSPTQELILQSIAHTPTSNLVTVGGGDPGQYVYKSGYYWDGHAWQPYNLSGTDLVNKTWYTKRADATIPNIGTATYFLGYVCQQVSGVWKCGCKDTACVSPTWQLQEIVSK